MFLLAVELGGVLQYFDMIGQVLNCKQPHAIICQGAKKITWSLEGGSIYILALDWMTVRRGTVQSSARASY